MAEVALSARGALRTEGSSRTASVLVLQTLVFQLLPYDSSAIGGVSMALRIGSLLLVASALGRVGATVDDERVVARAGWVQAATFARVDDSLAWRSPLAP